MFLKSIFAVFLCLIVLVAGFLFHNSKDVELNPEFEAFFEAEDFNAVGNFHVALAGIYAPEGHEDLYAYGLERIGKDSGYEDPDSMRVDDGDIDFDAFCYSQADYREKKDCDSNADVDLLLTANHVLLQRYRDLYTRRDLQANLGDLFHVEGTYMQDLIQLHKLSALQWIKMAKNGQGSDSIFQILLSLDSIQDVISGKISAVDHAVWAILFDMNLDVLPIVLAQDEAAIEQYGDSIEYVLGWDYSFVKNVPAVQQVEYNLLRQALDGEDSFFLKVNDTKNKYDNLAQTYIELSEVEASKFNEDDAFGQLSEHDLCRNHLSFSCWVYNFEGNVLLGSGMLRGVDLYKNAHTITAKQRAVVVWMKAKAQNVFPQGMQAFLAESDPLFYDPFTEKPFVWDAETGSVSFVAPNENGDNSGRDLYYP